MIRHEAVVVTAEGRGFHQQLMQEPAVGFVIGRFVEYRLAVVPPRKDVIGGLRSERSGGSRHLSDL